MKHKVQAANSKIITNKYSNLRRDTLATELLPDGYESEKYIPLKATGLGNCLYNSASLLMKGKYNKFTFKIQVKLLTYYNNIDL